MKKIAISQSNYIPWKGYFDLIASVDEFILYDDMQYTKRDWRNRNQIKTSQGKQWLTIPVKIKSYELPKIRDVEIDGTSWVNNHWQALIRNYRRAPYFQSIAEWLESLYFTTSHTHLYEWNRLFIETICQYLGIKTMITNSWDYLLIDGKTERLVSLCEQASATHYTSGPAAKNYLDEALFIEKDIQLTWFSYSGYSEYPQLWGPFIHEVSILDLLFNCGKNAYRHMKHVLPGQ